MGGNLEYVVGKKFAQKMANLIRQKQKQARENPLPVTLQAIQVKTFNLRLLHKPRQVLQQQPLLQQPQPWERQL